MSSTAQEDKKVAITKELQRKYLADPVIVNRPSMPPQTTTDSQVQSTVMSNQAAHVIDTANSAILISEDNILKIPEDQFPPNLAFRPGCAVICMNHNGGRPVPSVTFGTVLYAAVDLRSRTRAYVYKIQATRRPTTEAFFAREHSLQFAQATPVWAKVSAGYEECYVFSCFQKSHGEMPVYSVIKVADQGLYNGVPASRVKCRTSSTSKPADDEQELRSVLSQNEEDIVKKTEVSTWTGFSCSDMFVSSS